jgi:hypothetical protein
MGGCSASECLLFSDCLGEYNIIVRRLCHGGATKRAGSVLPHTFLKEITPVSEIRVSETAAQKHCLSFKGRGTS